MLVTRDEAHVYTDESGRVLLGVSSVLAILAGKEKEEPSPAAVMAMARGTAAHLATELSDQSDLDETSLDPLTAVYVMGWRRFREETGFKPTALERVIWSETHGYAGTLDRLGEIGGDLYLIDIKTGQEYRTHPIQTAAYALAVSEMDGIPYSRIKRACVYLTRTGSYSFRAHKDKEDRAVWTAALVVAEWRKRNG